MKLITRPFWVPLGLLTACSGGATLVTTPPPEVAAADSAIRSALANERAIDAAAFPVRSVGVAPFQVISSDTSLAVLGFGLADLLMTDLARSAQLQVVDRLRLDALVREMGLVTAGYVDSSSAPRFGRIVGARRIVLGSLVTTGAERIRLDGRVGDVLTGAVASAGAMPAGLDALLDAEKALAFAVFDRLGVVLAPAERALVEQRPTRNLAALLAYSRGVRAEVMRDYRGARQEYRNALRLDARFGNARSKLERVDAYVEPAGAAPGDLVRVGALAVESVSPASIPRISSAADPAFRQPLTTTLIIILSLP